VAGTNDSSEKPDVTRVTSEFVPPPDSPAKETKATLDGPTIADSATPAGARTPGPAGTPAPTKSGSGGVGSSSGPYIALGSGSTLGPWTIEEELGRGGMGIVFAAHSPTGAKVALKVLRDPSRGRLVQRFLRETHALGRLDHPNIVRLIDYGDDGVQPYYVMDYVQGETFEKKLASGRLSLQQKIKILAEVARGVAHAHGHAVIHRDLKPQNVIVDDALVPKIMDFGLARITDEGEAGRMTMSGAALGTPSYMSPEQFRGKRADARTDVYALGVMLFECVEGRLPFDTESDLHQLGIDVVEKPPPVPHTDERLCATILRALEKDPQNRHPTALELARDLEAWLAGDRSAPSVSGKRSPSKRLDAATPSGPLRAPSGRAPTFSPPRPQPNANEPFLPLHVYVLGLVLLAAGAGVLIWRKHIAATTPPPPAPAPPTVVAPTLPPPSDSAPPPVDEPPKDATPTPEHPETTPANLWLEASEGGFRVAMPGAPETTHDTLRVTSPRGGNTIRLKRTRLRLEQPEKNRVFSAMTVEVPSGYNDPGEPLLIVARGVCDEIGLPQTVPVQPLHSASMLGIEFGGDLAKDKKQEAHVRLFITGVTVYALVAIAKDARDEDATKFMDSFRLGG